MEMVLIDSVRGTRILVEGKHKKTIPKKMAPVFVQNSNKIEFKKKRLSPDERKLLLRNLLYQEYLKKLNKANNLLYDLIKESTPTAARKVITPERERLEIQLDNGLKITCPTIRLFKLFPHSPDAYLNY